MPGEKTTSSSKANNVLRLPLLDHLATLLERFTSPAASKPSSVALGRCEPEGEHSDTIGNEDGSERQAEDGHEHVRLAKWTVGDLDVEAWMAWELVGLQLFSGDGLPAMRACTTAARWVLMVAAIERCDGNITRMAAALRTSRRALREHLKAAGLYVEQESSTEAPTDHEPSESAAPASEIATEHTVI